MSHRYKDIFSCIKGALLSVTNEYFGQDAGNSVKIIAVFYDPHTRQQCILWAERSIFLMKNLVAHELTTGL
jgi:hypothetical protein